MKADAITPGKCKLVPGCLVTVSVDVTDSCIVKVAGIQCDYVITM